MASNFFIADPNIYYSLTYGWHDAGFAYLAPNIYVGGYHADVNANSPGGGSLIQYPAVQWQFYPVTSPPNGTYFLRSHLQQNGYFNSYNHSTGNQSACIAVGWDCSIGLELNTYLPTGSVWTFENTGGHNDTYWVEQPGLYGDARLDIWPDGTALRMSHNITAYQAGQAWQIKPVMPMNKTANLILDGDLLNFTGSSTVPLNLTAVMSTWSTASAVSSPSPTSSSSGSATTPTPSTSSAPARSHAGLSTAAKAGIAASVGVVAVALLGLLLFYWLMRRRRRAMGGTKYYQARSHSEPVIYDQSPGFHREAKPELPDSLAESTAPLVHEAPAEAVAVEAPSNPGRYELEGDLGRVCRGVQLSDAEGDVQ